MRGIEPREANNYIITRNVSYPLGHQVTNGEKVKFN